MAPRAHLLLLPLWCSLTAAIKVDICSSFNTSPMARNVSIYQSNGLCHDFCIAKTAFAITQANGCWCADYFPPEASQVDSSKCSFPCPGFPDEDCGGTALFGYLLLNQIAPSGTASPTSSKAMTITVTAGITKTVQVTAVSSPSSSSSSTSETPTPTSSTSSASSSSTSSSRSSSSPTLSSPVQTITDGSGAVRTVTVSPTPEHSSKLGAGAIAGIAVGVVAGVLILAGALFFLWRKRRNADEYRNDPSARGSSSGMIASTLPEMSMNGETSTSPGSVGNRNSTIQIDPRMDPFKQGLYLRNGSHESVDTIRDDHDYSRRIQPPKVLRATNPDPDT